MLTSTHPPQLASRWLAGALLLALLAGGQTAANPMAPSTRTVIPQHGQLLVFQQPAGFVLLGEQQQGGLYLREALPEGEDRSNWTQLLTVLAHRGSPDGLEATPAGLVRGLAAA
ncbi:MAG TPA: hypothetical protein PK170_12355, partial [Anaerolineae bacterium]|nr:hypothetical protein [Anaerolineae bacterium]